MCPLTVADETPLSSQIRLDLTVVSQLYVRVQVKHKRPDALRDIRSVEGIRSVVWDVLWTDSCGPRLKKASITTNDTKYRKRFMTSNSTQHLDSRGETQRHKLAKCYERQTDELLEATRSSDVVWAQGSFTNEGRIQSRAKHCNAM